MTRPLRLALGAVGHAVLAGCASLGIDDAVKQTNSSTAQFTGGNLELSRTKEQRDARLAVADELLGKPLTQDAAVHANMRAWAAWPRFTSPPLDLPKRRVAATNKQKPSHERQRTRTHAAGDDGPPGINGPPVLDVRTQSRVEPHSDVSGHVHDD